MILNQNQSLNAKQKAVTERSTAPLPFKNWSGEVKPRKLSFAVTSKPIKNSEI
jgi:hypothetical protein